jgi:hypothetical protein
MTAIGDRGAMLWRAAPISSAHAVCVGDRRPYNVALIVLDREVLACALGGSPPSGDALRNYFLGIRDSISCQSATYTCAAALRGE